MTRRAVILCHHCSPTLVTRRCTPPVRFTPQFLIGSVGGSGRTMDKCDTEKADQSKQNAKEDLTHAETNEDEANESPQAEVENDAGADVSESNEKNSDATEKTPSEPNKTQDHEKGLQAQNDATQNNGAEQSESSATSSQPLTSASHDLVPDDAQVEQLQSMFPAFHKVTVSDILKARRNNMESGMSLTLMQRFNSSWSLTTQAVNHEILSRIP